MTIRGQLTKEDYGEAQRLMLRAGYWRIGSVFFGMAFLGLGLHREGIGAASGALWLGQLCLVAGLVLWVYLRTRPGGLAGKFAATTYLHAPRYFEITPEGLAITSPDLSVKLGWKRDFASYRLGREVLIAVQPGGHYQILARRWFSPEQFALLKSYLHSALGRPSTIL